MNVVVYVDVLSEPKQTWLPMPATQIQSGVFLILEPTQDIGDRQLEFPPGAMVRCERRMRDNGILGWFATDAAS